MENLNALADIANTKAADAAKSPMPPPPATPASSGKKRKRSEAAKARDKLVTSKKCQTYKLYEELYLRDILKDPSELDKLKKYLSDMAILEIGGYREYKKDMVATQAKLKEKQQELQAVCERQRKNYEDATKSYKELREKQFIEFLKWKSEYNTLRCETMEEKMKLMVEREELQKTIKEQSQWKEKYEKVYEEVKELRKLKYAADRKEKGPVGVVR